MALPQTRRDGERWDMPSLVAGPDDAVWIAYRSQVRRQVFLRRWSGVSQVHLGSDRPVCLRFDLRGRRSRLYGFAWQPSAAESERGFPCTAP